MSDEQDAPLSDEPLPVVPAVPARLIGFVPFAHPGISAAIEHALDNVPPNKGNVSLTVGINGDGPSIGFLLAKRIGMNWEVVAVAEATRQDGQWVPEGAVTIHGEF